MSNKMRTYIPPEGWIFDSKTGRYWEKIYTVNEMGNNYMVMNWFDPIEGTYQQYSYFIDPVEGITSVPAEAIPKDPAPWKRQMLTYPTAKQKLTMLCISGGVFVVCFLILNFIA